MTQLYGCPTENHKGHPENLRPTPFLWVTCEPWVILYGVARSLYLFMVKVRVGLHADGEPI